VAAAAVAALAVAAAAGARAAEKVWVELESPSNEVTVKSPVGRVEIKGWTGSGLRGGHDVLLVIDRSSSVWSASGSDIDGDGKVGRDRDELDLFLDFNRKSTDPDDTILRAELAAARKLIERMDTKTTRMGLMSFGGGARIHAPIGSSQVQLLAALQEIPREPDFGGTSFDKALKLARLQFEAQPRPADVADRRNFSVILLSDGAPTAPAPVEHAEAFAILSARDAAELGVRIYAFAIGSEAVGNRKVYEEMTNVTGGELVLVDKPGEVIDFVPHLSLTSIARVEIDNLSSSEKARAVRLFPDGTFDGYAPLREGWNTLRITSVGEDGYERVVDRRVFFEKTPDPDQEQQAKARELVRDLKVRTLETELAEQARKKLEDSTPRRSVSIEAK
jgi:uncharacterized protein YegL